VEAGPLSAVSDRLVSEIVKKGDPPPLLYPQSQRYSGSHVLQISISLLQNVAYFLHGRNFCLEGSNAKGTKELHKSYRDLQCLPTLAHICLHRGTLQAVYSNLGPQQSIKRISEPEAELNLKLLNGDFFD
jgi:hypothetical protein